LPLKSGSTAERFSPYPVNFKQHLSDYLMKKQILLGLAALVIGSPLLAQDEAAVRLEIEKTREVIAQYVKTRQEIARLKNEWKAYQELSERRISLYQREIDQLSETIQVAEEETTQAEREIARIRDEIAVLRQANDVVARALPALEDKLRELYQYFPRPLKTKTQRLVQQLGKGRQASDRMAILIGILNEVDKFNAEFTFDTDEKTLPGGETKLVDVIYLGLAVAYYADKDGIVGGVGVPAEGDWQWTERNDLAGKIRMAVRYYQNEIKPAMLVELPLEIQNVTIGR
jgi:predicted  nucleic acid-binding Zn-ribbon protein